MPEAPLLRADQLRPAVKNFDGALPRAPFSVTITVGEQVALLGARGAGKTAVARALALIQTPAGGRVLFAGREITRLGGGQLRALRRELQFVGGHPLRILPPRVTVRAALLEPLQIHWRGSAAEQRARVEALAAHMELNPLLLDRRATALSSALRQRVAVARALGLHPRLLICDELADHLDPAAVRPLLARLAHICRAEAITWLWTTTDPALAAEFSDRVVRLESGQLV